MPVLCACVGSDCSVDTVCLIGSGGGRASARSYASHLSPRRRWRVYATIGGRHSPLPRRASGRAYGACGSLARIPPACAALRFAACCPAHSVSFSAPTAPPARPDALGRLRRPARPPPSGLFLIYVVGQCCTTYAIICVFHVEHLTL